MKFFIKCDECFNEFKLHGKIIVDGTLSHTTRCPFCDKLFEVSISVKHDFEGASEGELEGEFEGEFDTAKFTEELKNLKDCIEDTIYE